MAELHTQPEEIASALRKRVEEWKPTTQVEDVGRVLETGGGIARVSGLPNAMANELLEFPQNLLGLAFNLEESQVGCVMLGRAALLRVGDPVRQTGRFLSVPVGDGMLGRVLDALGRPVDGVGPVGNDGSRALEIQAPSVVDRQSVNEPLQTGLKVVDSMTAIGRGQRELILGDRGTGKSTIAVDTIINQRQYWGTPKQVKCIYVAVGQRASTVAQVVEMLRQHDALKYTVVVAANASDPASHRYLAPYAGCAMGAYWMYRGEHALVVYDDLSKQADAYRQLSLLLGRPSGREGFPGDVFYLHSRLLERSAKLSDELGGGSMTALPICETKAGDVSGYIPTNDMSITDGQIFLETDLFFEGVRPAMNVGMSLSRVGGAAQIKAMKEVAGTLRLDLASYRELVAFAKFGSELDKSSRALLTRGSRLVELLKQPSASPMPVEEMVISIYAGTQGFLDDLPISEVNRFEGELLDFFRARHGDILDHLRHCGDLPQEVKNRIDQAIRLLKASFEVGKGTVATQTEGSA